MGIEHKFGVEVETIFSREEGAKLVAKHFGTEGSVRHARDSYDSWYCKDSVGREWRFMNDSSVRPSRSTGYQQACEVVTPLLNWGELESFQEVIRLLRSAGAYSNASCGVHVHVDGSKLDATSLRSLVNLTNAQEDFLTEALGISPGRRWRWCKEVNQDFLKALNEKKPKSLPEFEALWYSKISGGDRRDHYDDSRYHLLNLHSFFSGKGVEFRAFDGTLHAGKLKAYVQLSCAMVGKAEASKSSRPERPQSDNHAYTFRCWLLRLGLIGDEYKTARKHLLSKLSGNAAFRKAPETRRLQPESESEG